MDRDSKNITKHYLTLLENDNISNNMSGKDVSTKFQVNSIPKFLPVAQEMEEEKMKSLPSEGVRKKLEEYFTGLTSLIKNCESKNCSSKDVSRLIEMLDSPRAKADLNDLKSALQLQDQHSGANAKFSS
jgi:hypothetical protein